TARGGDTAPTEDGVVPLQLTISAMYFTLQRLSMRTTALITILLGATGSFGLMLNAGRNQPSLLLTVLFTGWVLAPFAAILWAHMASKPWTPLLQRTLYGLEFLITAGSLTIYGSFALGALKAKAGFIFLVVPAVTWIVTALALGLSALKSR